MTLDVPAARRTIHAACEKGRFEHTRLVVALDALDSEPPAGVEDALLQLATALLRGDAGSRPPADVLERCVELLSREPCRAALDVYRAAVTTYLPSPRGDLAASLRGKALLAIHALEPREAMYLASSLVADADRSPSGEPARSALYVLGAASSDAALLLACETVLRDDIPLSITALEQLTPEVPPSSFWRVAAPFVGDRFSDAVLAIVDIIVRLRRADLLAGLADTLPEVGDPNLVRAVLLSLVAARIDGVDAVFAALVEHASPRAMPGVEDALQMARIPDRDGLLSRLQERARSVTASPT